MPHYSIEMVSQGRRPYIPCLIFPQNVTSLPVLCHRKRIGGIEPVKVTVRMPSERNLFQFRLSSGYVRHEHFVFLAIVAAISVGLENDEFSVG